MAYIADLCFILIEQNKLKEEAINWIVDYLHNYRMGRIDIVRSKIENFLINVSDSDINNTILKLLESERIAVRESAADISGQKELHTSIDIIINLLRYEKNPHVARSFITALARLKATNATTVIYEWMEQNKDKWGTQAVSASLKNVALMALRDLNADDTLISKLYGIE
jgi:HEAT repeat protein